jgi:hypothetical protein
MRAMDAMGIHFFSSAGIVMHVPFVKPARASRRRTRRMFRDESKRKYVRINNQFNVRIVARDEKARHGTREINTSRSINVSASGLLVNAAERINAGTNVMITFMKPNTFDFFKGKGNVVRVDDNDDGTYKIAISFIDLSHDDMQMLDYYIHLGSG